LILFAGAACLSHAFKFSVKPQEAILILITMFWGGTFLAVQYAVTSAIRSFLLACALRRRRLPWADFA
jgi:hypothetical protein